MKPHRTPTHPGEMLLEEWVKPAGWTVAELAERMSLKSGELRLFLWQRTSATPDLVARQAAALDTAPEFWLNLQGA